MNNINVSQSVLMVGGYGVVGEQAATIFRQRFPEVPLLLAGRSPSGASKLIKSLGNAEAIQLDVMSERPLDALTEKPVAVLSVVNDPYNYLLADCLRLGIPYLDITRWTEVMCEAIVQTSFEDIKAPVMLGSAWMAGVTAIVTKAASKGFSTINNIDIDVLFALADKSGPNSAEFMDRIAVPFLVTENGEKKLKPSFSEPKTVSFPGGYTGKTYRFDMPDQITLPFTTGASSVSGRIGFDSALSTSGLAALVRTGVMTLLGHPIFGGLRRSILHNPGQGAAHEVVISLQGVDDSGQVKRREVTMLDPLGQTHLTALGAVIQLERMLGLDGLPASSPGIHYPEQHPNINRALEFLQEHGVLISDLS